jgi:hypothetical protein
MAAERGIRVYRRASASAAGRSRFRDRPRAGPITCGVCGTDFEPNQSRQPDNADERKGVSAAPVRMPATVG